MIASHIFLLGFLKSTTMLHLGFEGKYSCVLSPGFKFYSFIDGRPAPQLYNLLSAIINHLT